MSPRTPSLSIGSALILLAVGGCSELVHPYDAPSEPPYQEPPVAPPQSDERALYVSDASGGPAKFVAEGVRPAWSPNGRRIVFHRVPRNGMSSRLERREGEIYVVEVDGSDETLLARGIEPAWSPDGERIAFEHRGDGEIGSAQIFVMDADGSHVRRLTPTSRRQYAESDPAWSPDGSRIAFWTYERGISTVPATGGTPFTVYADPGSLGYRAKPAWTPDGATLGFTVRTGSGWDCSQSSCTTLTVHASGGRASTLHSSGYHTVWSPRGGRIAFVSGR